MSVISNRKVGQSQYSNNKPV
ncbi:hypothetical protein SYE_00980, partial [Staphylococcus aureus M0326]